MKIENIRLSELKPLERNVRKHNVKQIAELVKSIKAFGQTRAIVIDEDNTILIGNGLYMAMSEIGMESADCYRKDGLSENEKKKLILADNKIYSLGVDDFMEIESYLKDIGASGDFEVPGFDEEVIKALNSTEAEMTAEAENFGKTINTPTPVRRNEPTDVPQMPTEASHEKVDMPTMSTPNVEAEPREERHVRTIICPNCGEVIYLD